MDVRRVLAASDLHLGAPLSEREPFIRLLLVTAWAAATPHRTSYPFQFSPEGADTLVFVGDLFNAPRTALSWLDVQLLLVVRALRECGIDVVLVPGNHDRDREKPPQSVWQWQKRTTYIREIAPAFGIRVVPRFEWNWRFKGEVKRCTALHGDHFDRCIRIDERLARRGAAAYTSLQKLPLVGKAAARAIKKNSKKLIRNEESVAAGALAYAREEGFDVIVCGHVHKASRIERDGILYINTGSWVEEICTYVLFDDTEDPHCTLDHRIIARARRGRDRDRALRVDRSRFRRRCSDAMPSDDTSRNRAAA
jgi:UDP-2,3-diacylglucosamine pyrophosphatase LpxH